VIRGGIVHFVCRWYGWSRLRPGFGVLGLFLYFAFGYRNSHVGRGLKPE
tara:strand:- start:232 stop:378 length:147 start_codon:yes stop_codon:yes gene_type:complete